MTRIELADFSAAEDRAAIAEILAEYAQEMGEALASPAAEVLDGLSESGNCLTWIAWNDNVPAGLAICFRLYSTFAGKPTINIHDLAVCAGCRGRGIGTALLETVIREASDLGCAKVTLEVRDDRPDAAKLYHRLGFADPDGNPTRYLSLKIDARGEFTGSVFAVAWPAILPPHH